MHIIIRCMSYRGPEKLQIPITIHNPSARSSDLPIDSKMTLTDTFNQHLHRFNQADPNIFNFIGTMVSFVICQGLFIYINF